MRFQEMAPSRAAITTTRPGLIASVLAIVFDTLAWKKATVITAPTRLKTAARPTAARGDSARVEIDVAIALAVSWKPFVKSNATATPIVIQSRIAVSCILDRDGLHHVGGVLACIHRRLEQVVDVLPLHELGGVRFSREEVADRGAGEAVALVFQPVYLEAVRLELGESLEAVECGGDLDPGLGQVFAHLLSGIRDVLYPVQVDLVACLLGKVDDIVETRSQEKDVLFVERCDERAVDEVVDLMGGVVALVLQVEQPRVPALAFE